MILTTKHCIGGVVEWINQVKECKCPPVNEKGIVLAVAWILGFSLYSQDNLKYYYQREQILMFIYFLNWINACFYFSKEIYSNNS